MKYPRFVALLLLFVLGSPLAAQGQGTGIPKAGVMVGAVVDPYISGIEQVHAAAAVVLAYQKRVAVSLRPTLLFSPRSVYFRVPLLLEIPLFAGRRRASDNEPGLTVCAVGGGGVGTWDGPTAPELRPLLSGGVELCFRSLFVSGLITAVVRENDLDLLTDLFLGYLWEL